MPRLGDLCVWETRTWRVTTRSFPAPPRGLAWGAGGTWLVVPVARAGAPAKALLLACPEEEDGEDTPPRERARARRVVAGEGMLGRGS